MKTLELPEELSGPYYVRVAIDGTEKWMRPDFATVARWREVQQAAITGNDKHTLLQFRMATIMLEHAAQEGVPDDVVLMPSLGIRSETKLNTDFETDPRFVIGANGGVRFKQTFDKLGEVKKSGLTVVE